jgi:hypothetical protein
LLGSRVEAVFESSQRHTCRITSLNVKSTSTTGRGFLPVLKDGVSAPKS